MTMKGRVLLVGIVMLAEMWLVGCGHYNCGTTFGASSCSAGNSGLNQGNGNTTKGTYLLIANAGGIQGEVLDPTAKTINITPGFGTVSTPGTNNIPGDWMVVAGGKFMYSAYSGSGLIFGWTLNGTGTITAISGVTPLSALYLFTNTSAGTQAMVANPAGTLLFVLDQNNEQVDVYQIGSTGALSSNPAIIQLPSGFRPYNLAVDGQGKFLYISNIVGLLTTEVAVYNISSATLNPPVAMTLQQMQGEASGTYMIGTRADIATFDNNLHVMSINSSTGALTEVGTGLPTTDTPALVAVQPNPGGTLVYSFGFGSTIEGASFNLTTGSLTPILGSTATGISGEFDPSGKYLFVVEDTSNPTVLDAFDVSASSTLTTPLANVPWAPGAWQTFDTQ
ncbi:MAG: beta-propeller fold lactonase family protein [Acidobacteriia bacterium]|nr:beta-propeller fold lactonase family protein [Terriglobia bacterium]